MHSDVPSHITEGLLQMGSEVVSTLGVIGTAEKKQLQLNACNTGYV